MNLDARSRAVDAIYQAKRAMRQGDRRLARQLAERAASLAPDLEDPWLLLAALSSPETSLRYLKRALEINPSSQAARQGFHWALHRQRHQPGRSTRVRPAVTIRTIPEQALISRRPSIAAWLIFAFLILGGLAIWFGTPQIGQAIDNMVNEPAQKAIAVLMKITITPTPTATFTPTLTPTSTPTSTPTPTETPTPTPTETPTPEPTSTPELPDGISVENVTPGEHWIDVDLSDQRAYAYSGTELVNSFLVSTGTWIHPTVTGQFQIYVKYRYADMSGPGYYLPDVPYVMYFYDGYGLHGTYWHNNFGTPMSHGCVNFSIDDAGWIFDFTEVGTLVNVHN